MVYINISFFVIFLMMMIISSVILRDMELEKYFKQGKIGSIRAFYVIMGLIMSFLVAFAFKEIASSILSFIN